MNKIELLAPAGNFDCLVASVQSGADAVYLSGKSFGARSFADNFDFDTLEKAVDYCHLRGTKVYVTVNTLVSDNEIDELCDYLRFLNQIGTDAIIVQDMGVVKIATEIVPDLPIHASTQMTVHNSEGVKALEALGVKRIVLSREVSLENIKRISQSTTAELEVFGHGALCMCYSGQCLMSSIIGGRSGNRGKCAQPCRLPYSVNGKDRQRFYMSLKDLSSLELLDEIHNAGVASLKIEGRMKGPAYVAAVVGIYRKYIDEPTSVKQKDLELLNIIFNRGGLTDGYLTKKLGKNMFAFDKPDNPYRMGSEKLVTQLLDSIKSENKKIKLNAYLKIKKDALPQIYISYNDFKVEYIGETVVQEAVKAPLTEENVIVQLNKTGGTPFEFVNITVDLEENSFLTASALNTLRRNVLEIFEKEYIKSFKRNNSDIQYNKTSKTQSKNAEFVCEINNIEQFDTVAKYEFSKIYIPLHIILENPDKLNKYKKNIVIVPPAIIHENEFKNIADSTKTLLENGFCGVCATNIALIKVFEKFRIFGGFRLNIFNSFALEFYKNQGLESVELSPELNFRQLQALNKPIPTQMIVYGRLPLMITENCVIKNGDFCPCQGNNYIIDRMGKKFPVIKDGDSCRSVILNCNKTFLGFDMEKVLLTQVQYLKLYFTDESPEECIRICDSFFKNTGYRPKDFTKGHFVKGVI